MARPSKASKEKAAVAAGTVLPVPAAPISVPGGVMPNAMPPRQPVIDVENFIRVRDSVHGRMATIQKLFKSFSDDYIRQTNLLLGLSTNEDGSEDALVNLDATISAINSMHGLILPSVPVVEEKKERKKRTHDPNAPKRPLTPYFLYMQTARPIIANDLGSEAPKRAVQDEGQRRWASMEAEEKEMWNTAYRYNLRLYNARVHSYKHSGNENAKDMSDEEANKYAIEHGITIPGQESNDQSAIAEQLQAATGGLDAQGEEDADLTAAKQPGAAKPKKPTASRKRKSATDGDDQQQQQQQQQQLLQQQMLVGAPGQVAPLAAVMPGGPVVVPVAAPGADKKRRRTSTKGEDGKEEPKKAGRKKAVKA
ncbi:hypothetical protein TD95_002991 [Thielaviopsis punctulata]|uniref:HMG box domain-containing protein n=1 Tax=Thielaviopsis punctulata TaxID=72032 RepID=A0A0F4ZIP7_9PEZI|nr:hypothetical protein TD95_002991 [Thielaviopsis punctulata]